MRLGFSSSAGAPIYDDYFSLLQGFVVVCIEHCDREANNVSHRIARVALALKDNCIWVNEPPSFIIEALVNDITLFSNQ